MLNPCCDIRIQNNAGKILYFDVVQDLEIIRTWRELTSTASFFLPRNIKGLKGERIDELIQPGNKVVIKLGFNLEFAEEFTGEIVNIGSTNPAFVYCEDGMRQLKRGQKTVAYSNAKLSKLIKDIVPPGIPTDVIDASIGDVRFSKKTPAMILHELRTKYGIYSYFRGSMLCVGFAYPLAWAGDKNYLAKFHFQKSILDNNLEFKSVDEVNVKIRVSSLLADNKVVFVEVGDPDGEQRNLHFYNISDKAELRRRGEAELARLKYAGYRGAFKSLGFPYVEHGYTVQLEDYEYPERTGKYFADKVTVLYGNGYYRITELGAKAD
ncbi:MAG: hypothetical protein R2800_09825 [Flavipsychrobacter sp.]